MGLACFWLSFLKNTMMALGLQVGYLFLLAIPVACISWTVMHEEVFREPRDFCIRYSQQSRSLLKRKFFYLFTCEYCFSHYVTIIMLMLTKFHLLFNDWKGYLISGFSLVWIANIYMSLFLLIRTDIKKEKLETKEKEVSALVVDGEVKYNQPGNTQPGKNVHS
jgi:hypothetical protein